MRRPQPIDYVILVSLAVLWGSSFSMIKVAMETITPLTAAAGRIALAAVILGLIAVIRREHLPKGQKVWAAMAGVGLMGNTVPFFLINLGETRIDAGLASVLMSFVPIFTVLLAHVAFHDEKLSPVKLFSIVLGFAGILILVGPEALEGVGSDLWYQLAVLGGAACYATAGVLARALAGQPKVASGAICLAIAAIVSVPLALIFDAPWGLSPSVDSIIAVVLQGVFPTALATVLLLRLVAATGASFLAFNNYLVPVVGVGIGVVFLGEAVTMQMIIALIVILGAITISNLRVWKKK